MRTFVQFLTLNTKNEVDDLLGSDGVFILDGRNNFNTWIKDAHTRIKHLKNVQPGIIGFRIVRSSRSFYGTVIHEWKDQDKLALLRKGIKFDEDFFTKILLNEIDFIELNSEMNQYQVHLIFPDDKSSRIVRNYRGTKTIKFYKNHVEIR